MIVVVGGGCAVVGAVRSVAGSTDVGGGVAPNAPGKPGASAAPAASVDSMASTSTSRSSSGSAARGTAIGSTRRSSCEVSELPS